jgi:hypothetical protein
MTAADAVRNPIAQRCGKPCRRRPSTVLLASVSAGERPADATTVSELATIRAGPVGRLDTRLASGAADAASDQASAVSLADRSVGVVALAAALRVRSTPTAIAIATTAIVMSNA